jgi:transcriptional regulator with XRE-family HTH domain
MKRFCSEKFASMRKRKGKTQTVLSAETGISRVSISAIENGRKEPMSNTLARFAEALECKMDYFFVSN